MLGRRTSFWLAVAGVSILSNFVLEVVANRFPNAGLAQFTAYTHKGAHSA